MDVQLIVRQRGEFGRWICSTISHLSEHFNSGHTGLCTEIDTTERAVDFSSYPWIPSRYLTSTGFRYLSIHGSFSAPDGLAPHIYARYPKQAIT